ncbi:hypothetical protein EJB05_25970, partial [Eragrostis curvula]
MDITKLAGVDAVKLVMMILQAAQKVRHNKKTCQQLVHHVQIIGDLLKKLQRSEMMQQPEIRNGLNKLEEILCEAYMLVTSCQKNNYIYHLVMSGKQAEQFRVLQNRIASCLQVFPLISHIDTTDRLDQILEIIQPTHSKCAAKLKDAHYNYTVQLIDATNNFSHENQIGQGNFGCVYKGRLHNGLEVAVKRCFELSSSPNQMDVQDLEFQNEICFLTKLQHTNIIRLLGYCIHGKEKILVYEYVSNGSFDTFISGMFSLLLHLSSRLTFLCSFNNVIGSRTRRLYLDWPARSRIIKGIAEGLLYLHKHCGLHVIHGDLKPSNILLNSNMQPKISDFGFARMYNPDVDEEFADHIVGSIGFIAPECRERRLFSIKSDVYGFGALLLEAWHLWRAGRLIEFVDSPPVDESERMEILRCIQIALLCVEENPANRPSMQEVVLMLSCPSAALPMPQRPAYLRTEMARE